MSILRDRIIEEHIEKNHPNSKILNYNDADSDLAFYTAEELQNVDEDWFPLACYKDKKTGKAVYGGRKRVYHTYTEGETGAGKTTRFVMQSILALSSLKSKPSFVIVDIHGEIIENLYNHLKNSGYKIKILNCDDPQRSDTYNPFSELAEECCNTREISNDTINKLRRIAEIVQPVESTDDPIWDQGARAYTNGCILDKFEDLINGDLPKDCLTLYNVLQNHYWLRETLSKAMGPADLFKIPHYKKKGSKALSTQKMISVTNNAEKTRASYFGVVENHYDTFGQPSLYSLSSSNTIDISDFIDEPTVIVIQSGSTKIGDDLISLLVNEIYTYVVKKGKMNKQKKLPRNIHCFLDEFANCNIADGPEYVKMLTTSRKFGMFWHMILQCDAQLDRKFDSNIGRIIRANSTEIFMGSHDYETEVRFAKSCGKKTIESLSSEVTQQGPHLEVVDLMTTEKLNLIEVGCAYVKSNRHPLTKTYIEAFYNCDEFESVEDIDTVYPYNNFDYQQTSFFIDDIPPVLTKAEYEIIKYLENGKKSFYDIKNRFPEYDVTELVKSLATKKVVELLKDHVILSKVTKRQYELYAYRATNSLNELEDEGAKPEVKKPEMKVPRNPFDFDFDDDDDDEAEEDDIETVFKDWVESPEDNPLFVRFEARFLGKDVGNILKKIEGLTCVPDYLKQALEYIQSPETKKAPAFPANTNLMKFEIIEVFIQNNNFKTKTAWTDKIKSEVAFIDKENLFSLEVIDAFKNAAAEIDEELTIENILEIKRIINGN